MGLTIDTRALGTNVGGAASQNESFTVNTVSPFFVAIITDGTHSVTACSYNNVGMTKLGSKTDGASTGTITLFGLKSPSTGAHSVSAVFSASSDANMAMISTSGGDTTTGWRSIFTQNDGTQASTVMTITDSVVGDLVFHAAQNFGGSPAAIVFGAGEDTTNTKQNAMGGGSTSFGMGTKAGAANVNVSCNTPSFYSEVAVSVIPASASAGQLFLASNPLTGLAVGGPFFANPIG